MIDFAFPPPNRDFQSGVVAPNNPRETWFFAFSGNMILLNFDQNGDYQPLTDAAEAARLGGQQHFMGVQGEVACYAIDCENTGEFEVEGLRGVFGHISNDLLSLAGRALQICDWARTHQFCGKCGQAKRDHGKDRARVCDACGIHAYPRLSPSIIVLVHRDDEVLLARNHRFPAGMYSTLAGFVEPGESIEQTLHREVAEEVGVQLGKIEYLGSQPWPFPNSLMLGFHAEYESGDIVCQEEEIADAQWFPVDNLPAIPGPIAISRWLIDAYLARRGIDPHA